MRTIRRKSIRRKSIRRKSIRRKSIRRKSKGGVGRLSDMVSSFKHHATERVNSFMNPTKKTENNTSSERMKFLRNMDSTLGNKIKDLKCETSDPEFKNKDCNKLEQQLQIQNDKLKEYGITDDHF